MSTTVRYRITVILLTAALLATLTFVLTGGDRADAVDGPVDVVYVATGRNFPDALAGSTLATSVNAPLLTVEKDPPLPQSTIDALTALDPNRIVIFGGSAAVSDAVADLLAGYTRSGEVTRLSGTDRHATAAAIADALPGKVADADQLDGLDSTAFLRSNRVSDFLPADGTAVDAAALGSVAASDLRVLPLSGWTYQNGPVDATGLTGPVLPDGFNSGVGVTFLVPPGHQEGQPLHVDLMLIEENFGECTLRVATQGVASRDGSTSSSFVDWLAPGEPGPTVDFDTTSGRDNHLVTFTLESTAIEAFTAPGTAHTFVIRRRGDLGADTCTSTLSVAGAQLRY
jgi:hypothetical protein